MVPSQTYTTLTHLPSIRPCTSVRLIITSTYNAARTCCRCPGVGTIAIGIEPAFAPPSQSHARCSFIVAARAAPDITATYVVEAVVAKQGPPASTAVSSHQSPPTKPTISTRTARFLDIHSNQLMQRSSCPRRGRCQVTSLLGIVRGRQAKTARDRPPCRSVAAAPGHWPRRGMAWHGMVMVMALAMASLLPGRPFHPATLREGVDDAQRMGASRAAVTPPLLTTTTNHHHTAQSHTFSASPTPGPLGRMTSSQQPPWLNQPVFPPPTSREPPCRRRRRATRSVGVVCDRNKFARGSSPALASCGRCLLPRDMCVARLESPHAH